MKQPKFPITHHDLAKVSKLPIDAKILIHDLKSLSLRTTAFLTYLEPLFSLLKEGNPSAAYLTSTKRSNKFFYTRHFDFDKIPEFTALIDEYSDAPDELLDSHFFATLLLNFFKWYPKEERDAPSQIGIYFQRMKISTKDSKEVLSRKMKDCNENLLISTLIISRNNLTGGSSIIKNSNEKIIFDYRLQPGEFIFFGKTEENKNLENPVAHQLTPMEIENPSKGDGWLDFIQFEINILES